MLFYKIKIKSIPKIRFAYTFSSNQYYNSFSGDKTLFEIAVIDEGAVIRKTNEKTETVNPRDISYLLPDFAGTVYPQTPGFHQHTTVGVTLDFDYELLNSENFTKKDLQELKEKIVNENIALVPYNIQNDEQYLHIRYLIKQIAKHHTLGQFDDDLVCISLWFKLIAFLTQECTKMLLQSEYFNISPSALLYCKKTIKYIKENYNKRISVSVIAAELKISPNYLQTVFKKVMSVSIIEYANRLKIEMAKEYFTQRNATVKEVADILGFEDASYLSRLFKKVCGGSIHDFKETSLIN